MADVQQITLPHHLSPSDTVEGGDFFSKEMSVMMAGFAILLMMWHHLFLFSDWRNEGVEWEAWLGYIGRTTTSLLAVFGSICVQVFALMSGYALMINPKSYGTWRKRISRLLKFLFAYWIVNILFLIIGYFNGDSISGIKIFIYNLFGLKTGPELSWINVPFAWYVCYYIEFVLLSPLLIWGFSSKRRIADAAMCIALILMVFFARRIPIEGAACLSPLLSSVMGIMIAKYDILNKLHRLVTGRLHWTLLIVAIVTIIVICFKVTIANPLGGSCWALLMQVFLSVVAAALILFSVELFHRIRSRHFKNCFLLLGTLSMYLWFLHGIFFTGKNFMQPFIYSPKEPILILILCTVTLLPVAWALKKFRGYIDKKLSFL